MNRAGDDGSDWASRLSDFEGGVDALVSTLTPLVALLANEAVGEHEPTARMVRFYVSEGVLSRPERRGREAVYNGLHVAQFLAARVLLRDGWPLKKIADDLRHRTLEELIALVPAPPSVDKPSAVDVVRKLRSEAGASGFERKQKPSRSKDATRSSSASIEARQYQAAARRARLSSALSSLGSPPEAARSRDAFRIDLTDAVTVIVDRTALEMLTPSEAQLLCDALRDALLEARGKVDPSRK